MKIKRISEMEAMQKQLISMMWKDIANTPDDNQWRDYSASFKLNGMNLKLSCRFKLDNQYLSVVDMLVHRETETIQIPQGFQLH